MTLPVCSRSGDVIEPLIKPQWFLKTQRMYQRALEAVQTGELRLKPEFYQKEWSHWLTNHVDWCLSRQLWWGHQVPVWKAQDEGGNHLDWICALDETQANEIARQRGLGKSGLTLRRDDDVLDTWFSSAILPFANFGWPQVVYEWTATV